MGGAHLRPELLPDGAIRNNIEKYSGATSPTFKQTVKVKLPSSGFWDNIACAIDI